MLLCLLFLYPCYLALSSCNTISGIGKDVEAMGSKIDSASQATSKSMQ